MNEPARPATPDRRFRYTVTWPNIGDDDARDLLAFWKEHGAIPDEDQARQRLPQVLAVARDGEDRVAGVCTALAVTPAQLGQPVYFYRSFIAPAWRTTRLVYFLHEHAFAWLENQAMSGDYPCIGVILELENARFGKVGRQAVWSKPPFTYIGKSPRGLDVRVRYFRGAKLK